MERTIDALTTDEPRPNRDDGTPTITKAPPRLRLDDHGRIIPLTEAEQRARVEAIRKALVEMAAVPDDPPGSDEEFLRAIAEGGLGGPHFRKSQEP